MRFFDREAEFEKLREIEELSQEVAENGAYPPTQNGLIHPQLLLKWP